MKKIWKMLVLVFLSFVFFWGGKTLLSSAAVSVPSQTFDLWTNVDGVWDQGTQILTVQPRWAGTGQIVTAKWNTMVNALSLKTEEITKVEFKQDVWFPNVANSLFNDFKSQIIFPSNQYTSNVTAMASMFFGAVKFNSDISNWDVSNVTNMGWMFNRAESFNIDISHWNTNKVNQMGTMFYWAKNFNQPIGTWDTSNVTNMLYMFGWATNFNQPIGNWNTSNVKEMGQMFFNAKSFNQDLSHWNVSNVINMYGMFHWAEKFNGNISTWNTSKVVTMNTMFQYAPNFNQSIGNWNTEKVTNMYGMFYWATAFNQPIGNWNTSSVTTMKYMFVWARSFNQPIVGWNTSKVTDMYGMFHWARAFNQPIGNWDVEKVTTMAAMFKNAYSFDQDISGWNPKSLNQGSNFIFSEDSTNNPLSFSRENYEKLLKEWNTKLIVNKPDFPLTIQVPYCFQQDARKSLTQKGYKIQGDKRDCELLIGLATQTGSKHPIRSFLTVSSLLPADQIKAQILSAGSTASYAGRNCRIRNIQSPWLIECVFDILSTENGRNIKLKITDGVKTESEIIEYLIDNQGPELPQVQLHTKVPIEDTEIILQQFPNDRWGAGVKKCTLSYDGQLEKVEITSTPWSKSLKELKNIQADEKWVYTISVQCEDRLWNLGAVNEVKFPPIIEFSLRNKTIIKKNHAFTGTFTLYSPSWALIEKMEIINSIALGIQKVECKGSKDASQSWIFTPGNWQVSSMGGENDKDYKIECSYQWIWDLSWELKVQVLDEHGAQGKNSQSITIDDDKPSIVISPEQQISSGNINVTITITDNFKLNPDGITIDGEKLDLSTCTEKSASKLVCSYTIIGPVKDKEITVVAQDSAGNENTKKSWAFTIDVDAPLISNPISLVYLASGTIAKVSFSVEDNYGGVGLRTQTDYDNNVAGFDWNALRYFFSSQDDCSSVEGQTILAPWTTEPFTLNFEIDDANQNGKYLCVVVKDKVWNTQTGVLASAINLNLAPTLIDKTLTLDENTPITTQILTLDGQDQNAGDTLSYQIIGGNAGNAFSIAGDKLQVNGALDYETLSSYLLTIQVKDQLWLTGEAKVTITLNDVDEIPPVITAIASVSYQRSTPIIPIPLVAIDNSGSVTLQVNGLPAGLTFDAGSKIIGTTPATPGNYPIQVIATDQAGNQTTVQFTLTVIAPAIPSSSSSSRWGGWARLIMDHCPNGDFSASYYDGSCGNQWKPVETKEVEKQLFNPTIKTSCFNPLDQKTIDQGNAMTELLKQAHQMLYSYQLTRWQGTRDFAPERSLTRQEAARFMTEFATNVLCRKPSRSYANQFTDLGDADPTLLPYIYKSYDYLIFNGDANPNGDKAKTTFRPNDLITVDELSAIITRLVKNEIMEEPTEDRARNYRNYIGSIASKSALKNDIRWTVAEVIYDLYRNNDYELKEVGYVIKN